jgi:hypothetical protein
LSLEWAATKGQVRIDGLPENKDTFTPIKFDFKLTDEKDEIQKILK